jgi:hypothetical protein
MKQIKASLGSAKGVVAAHELLTSAEVRAILRCSRKTLYNYCHRYRGRPPLLTHINIQGRLLFRRQLIDYFLQQHELPGAYNVTPKSAL